MSDIIAPELPADEDKAAEMPLQKVEEFPAPPGQTGLRYRMVGYGSV